MIISLLRIFLFGVASLYIYRNRYRLMNGILGQPWLRKIAVRFFMQLPIVRNRMIGQMIKFQ